MCPRLWMVGSAGGRQGLGSRTLASSSNYSPTPKNPNVVNVPTLPHSHACDGQVGRVPRRSGASRDMVLQNHQLASTARAYLLRSGVRLILAHGEAVAQTSPSIDFAPHVRPRQRAGLGGFPPALVDASLNKAAVRDVPRPRSCDAARLLCSLLAPNPQRRGLRLVPRELSHLRRQLL